MGLAASAAILAGVVVLSTRESRDVAAAVPPAPAVRPAPSEHVTVLAMTRRTEPRRTEHNFAQRFTGASFADRFAGAPVWEGSYATARTETRATTAYA